MLNKIIIFILVASVNSFELLIGNYSQIDNEYCGLSRNSLAPAKECLKWHGRLLPSMTRTRNVTGGEAPWVVFIRINMQGNNYRCTGSIITKNRVITSGHCFDGADGNTVITVFTGYNFANNDQSHQQAYRVDGYIMHPNYNRTNNDLALVVMSDEFHRTLDKSKQFMILSQICLPEKNIINTENQLVYMAGWGVTYPMGLPLQIGERMINVHRDFMGKQIRHRSTGPFTCTGDSGAPLWQYYMGRAVLIGVHSRAYKTANAQCETPGYTSGTAERVSMHMDWILDNV